MFGKIPFSNKLLAYSAPAISIRMFIVIERMEKVDSGSITKPAIDILRHCGKLVMQVKRNNKKGENCEPDSSRPLIVKYRYARLITAACQANNTTARKICCKKR